MSSKSCSVNGGPGCVRGFVRERCHKCHLGSTACNMCHASPNHVYQQPPPAHPRHSSCSSSSSSSTASAASTPACSPRNSLSMDRSGLGAGTGTGSGSAGVVPASSLSFSSSPSMPPTSITAPKTLSISIQLPLPSGHPQRSLVTSSPTTPSPSKDIAFPARSMPSQISSLTTSYGPSSPCIFCFNGRKACEECFGLGYVQRICQDCLRDRHRSHSRKTSLPASWNQFGSRIKEQFMMATHRNPSSSSSSSSSLSTSGHPLHSNSNHNHHHPSNENKKKRTRSMVSLPLTTSLTLSPVTSPTLGPLREEPAARDQGEAEEEEEEEEREEEEQRESLEEGSNHHQTGDSKSTKSSTKSVKKSFKAAVLKIFHPQSLGVGQGQQGQYPPTHATSTSSPRTRPHRRQWSMPSLSLLSLPSASTAA